MYTPKVGEPCYEALITGSRYPYTVIKVEGRKCLIQAAKMIFDGPRYFDSYPVGYEENPFGKILECHYTEKRGWYEAPARNYTPVIVFGRYDYEPYLD